MTLKHFGDIELRLTAEKDNHSFRLRKFGLPQLAPARLDLAPLAEFLDSQNIVILDAGAHVGSFTIHMLHHFPNVVYAHLYEAMPQTAMIARMNLRRNGFENKTRLHECALVGGSQKTISFYVADYSTANSAVNCRGRKEIKVRARTINSELRKLNPKPNLAKIDIEGSEIGAIDQFLLPSVELLLLEFHFCYAKHPEDEYENTVRILKSKFKSVSYKKFLPGKYDYLKTNIVAFERKKA